MEGNYFNLFPVQVNLFSDVSTETCQHLETRQNKITALE